MKEEVEMYYRLTPNGQFEYRHAPVGGYHKLWMDDMKYLGTMERPEWGTMPNSPKAFKERFGFEP